MAFQESLLNDEQLAARETELSTIVNAREERWEANRAGDTLSDWREESDFSDFLEDNEGFDWDE